MRVEIKNAFKDSNVHKAISKTQELIPELLKEVNNATTCYWEAPAFDPQKAFLLLEYGIKPNTNIKVTLAQYGERYDTTSPIGRPTYKAVFCYGHPRYISVE